jgi:hypothetical protein
VCSEDCPHVAGPRGPTSHPQPCSPLAVHHVPHAAMDSLEESMPRSVGGCHVAEASGLSRPAAGPAAPPSAARRGPPRHPREPLGRQGCRSESPLKEDL